MRLRRTDDASRVPKPHHSYTAFSAADVSDAKRGHPDFDLRDYASARGLEFLDHTTPAGYRAAIPGDPERQSNVLRGVLPGGAYGVLAHEGLAMGYSTDGADWEGSFYRTHVTLKGGNVLSILGSAPVGTVRVPCTVAAVRVPEAVGAHPYIRIDTRRSSPPFSFTNRTKLRELGAEGWSLWCEPEPTAETVQRLVADPLPSILGAHREDGLFQIVVWFGTLIVRRNGYLRSPEELDELGRVASFMAKRVRDTCLPLAAPQPLSAELPRPLTSEARELPANFYPVEDWRKWALETAARHGLSLENPIAYHRAFPSAPVPGSAYVVLRGEVPHVGPGRLVVHRERSAFRPAVLVPAPPGASTEPGGTLMREHGLRLEISGGVAAAWATTSYWGDAMVGDVEAFCAAAGSALRELAR